VTITGGEGEFSCFLLGEGTKDGEGTLKLNGKEYKFKLMVKALAGSTALEVLVGGKVTATGTANFYASKNEEAKLCATVGVEKLEFNAVAAGTI
jgi:hypothetical protein